ncbi:hypothetical protein ACODT5_28795 [Streptomyces sp. 5.8]|uniref:hypothetical protein n=1 Tax=Streptomyces sp. 5.8 TaxID=3406571 RepID=UPI003BB53BA2
MKTDRTPVVSLTRGGTTVNVGSLSRTAALHLMLLLFTGGLGNLIVWMIGRNRRKTNTHRKSA